MKKEVMICDRCGEMYEVGQKAIVRSGSDGYGVKILYDVIITYRAKNDPNNKPVCGKELDLCPLCAGLFFNWLLNKTENGTILREPTSMLYVDDIGTGTKVIQPELILSKKWRN